MIVTINFNISIIRMFRLLNRMKGNTFFSQIKKQQIIDSDYSQLADKIALHYNLKQYKNQSGLCLLQLHHQFKIFKPGDSVLDVGSGIDYAWSDLALKLTDNQIQSNLVISNDILPLVKSRKNNVFVQGNIQAQPVQVKIGMSLQDRTLDSILIDLSPEFSGSVQRDGRLISSTISLILKFSFDFLKKGGTVVYKMLQSDAQNLLKEMCQNMFNETYKYVPSIIRKRSPVCFYVCKGYLISHNYTALTQFIENYKGPPEKKRKLVAEYKGKYNFDPEKVARRLMTSQVIRMKSQGRSEKDLIKVFGSDPFFKVQKTLNLLKKLDQYRQKNNQIMEAKVLNQLHQGDLYKQATKLPGNYDQYIQMMNNMVANQEQKTSKPKNTINRAPLKQGEQYMKQSLQKNDLGQTFQKTYYQSDLQGKYSQSYAAQQAREELAKMQNAFPQLMKMHKILGQEKAKNPEGTIDQIIKSADSRYELSPQKIRQIQMELQMHNLNMTEQQRQEQKQIQDQLNLGFGAPKKVDRPINHRVGRRRKPRHEQ